MAPSEHARVGVARPLRRQGALSGIWRSLAGFAAPYRRDQASCARVFRCSSSTGMSPERSGRAGWCPLRNSLVPRWVGSRATSEAPPTQVAALHPALRGWNCPSLERRALHRLSSARQRCDARTALADPATQDRAVTLSPTREPRGATGGRLGCERCQAQRSRHHARHFGSQWGASAYLPHQHPLLTPGEPHQEVAIPPACQLGGLPGGEPLLEHGAPRLRAEHVAVSHRPPRRSPSGRPGRSRRSSSCPRGGPPS